LEDKIMPTIFSNADGQVVEAHDAHGTYYYLADGLGEPTEGGWLGRDDAIARLEGRGPEPDFAIDTRGRRGLAARAARLGRESQVDYYEEFGARPVPGQEGDWAFIAWMEVWLLLESEGATQDDHEDCLQAWRDGFFGR
jgi:hypothetical protein